MLPFCIQPPLLTSAPQVPAPSVHHSFPSLVNIPSEKTPYVSSFSSSLSSVWSMYVEPPPAARRSYPNCSTRMYSKPIQSTQLYTSLGSHGVIGSNRSGNGKLSYAVI